MWILLRSPKMKGAIFGFQKRVWCPKWTPASSICRMDTPDMEKSPVWVEPPRIPAAILILGEDTQPVGLAMRVWCINSR